MCHINRVVFSQGGHLKKRGQYNEDKNNKKNFFSQTACPKKSVAVLFSQLRGMESNLSQTSAADASNVPAQADNLKSLVAQHYTGTTAHWQVIKQWIEL